MTIFFAKTSFLIYIPFLIGAVMKRANHGIGAAAAPLAIHAAKLCNTKLETLSALPSGPSILCSSMVGNENISRVSITAVHVSPIKAFRSNSPDRRPCEIRPRTISACAA